MPLRHQPSQPILPFVALSSLLVLSASGLAHDGEHDGKTQHASKQTELGKALVLPPVDGPAPWSDKPILSDPDRFSIAILTDRTGGHRPGIWMKAVERVNWLRPDFVLSVGDLIEGYTEDTAEIEKQWQEFLGFIDQLEMKFFFVAGNHDVTNPTMHRIWREKFGKEWYSFDYKGVHFVCLLSEDPSARLGEEQLEWLAGDLADSRDARWTLVFLHKPVWTYAERDAAAGNPDSTNWTRAAALLADRPHTVFAGHVHHYVQYQRNGHEYYSLATTGGGSQLRGPAYGEFDHITWLTMERDGPRVVNLLLDGIQPADVVTEESIQGFREFLANVQLTVDPILIGGDALQAGEIRLTIRNDCETPIAVDATIAGLPLVGLNMESQTIQASVAAGEELRRVIPFSMQQAVDLARFRLTTLEAKVASVEDAPLKAEWRVPVIIDREYSISSGTANIDGQIEEWATAQWWETDAEPPLAGSTGNWNGGTDASFRLAACFDESHVNFAVRITDERVMAGDRFTIALDPRPLLNRLERNRLGNEALTMTITAPESATVQACAISATGPARNRVRAFGRQVADGYELEFSAPLDALLESQGDDWANFQLGARLQDVDASEEQPCEILWRAAPNRRENRSFAHVIRQPD